MKNLLYYVALICVIFWLIGYLGYNSGSLIHVLLLIAIVVVLIKVFQGRKSF